MRVELIKIADWEDEENGLILHESDEWLLVKHIPVDFVIDGFKLYKKEFIEKRSRSESEILIEKVLKLKGVVEEKPTDLVFTDTIGFLQWSQKKYGLFEFQDSDQGELFYGRINKIINETLIIDSITLDGKMDYNFDVEFDIGEIRVITFETDYFNSIKLLLEHSN